jgi:hypothetical protein
MYKHNVNARQYYVIEHCLSCLFYVMNLRFSVVDNNSNLGSPFERQITIYIVAPFMHRYYLQIRLWSELHLR